MGCYLFPQRSFSGRSVCPRTELQGPDTCITVASMLVFVDESGHPHRKDENPSPVVVAACIREQEVRRVSASLFSLKRRLLGNDRADAELKAAQLLNRRTFRRVAEKRELVESFFHQLDSMNTTVFAIVMERPLSDLPTNGNHLPNQFRYLLQRANELANEEDDYATIMFDGNGSQFGGLAPRFASYLFRSNEGRQLDRIVDAPYFVDSRLTTGIQIADMVAGAVRIYEELNEADGFGEDDLFASAIERYYRLARRCTRDFETPKGRLSGFYRMPEYAHYRWEQATPEDH